ncbi:gluconokinase [Nocardioides sp. dk4132]|uniref:gluconokinase n=1 Tax=unclassified Nocardioides TaxID=2615069 RepID=UPI001295E65D|nr:MULTISPECIES: gluconokinase [unclassified Nocardioides]MQW77847.1 gluconokinase [Nocardioides sp. dk4132]QGA08238.1 gluconokinase [Nocardioides sp. dk884]
MESEERVRHIVVMGVSGVGKTTIAKGISTFTGWTFAEGDAFHPEANVAKMHEGHPLTDEDRWPWLRAIGAWMSAEIAEGRSAVITCSALRRAYRDLLREDRPEVEFCHLAAQADLIGDRLSHRDGHFMPPSLLPSQYATLEPLEDDEPGVTVSVEGPVPDVLTRVVASLHLPDRRADDHPDPTPDQRTQTTE